MKSILFSALLLIVSFSLLAASLPAETAPLLSATEIGTPPAGNRTEYTAPYTQNFNGGTFPPTDWGTLCDPVDPGVIYGWTASSGQAMLLFHYLAVNAQAQLISPYISIPGPLYRLSWKWSHGQLATSYNVDSGWVEISANYGPFENVVWNRVATEFNGSNVTESIDLTPYAGQTIQVRFRGQSGLGPQWYVDDFAVQYVDSSINTFPNNQTFAATSFPPAYWTTPNSWEAPNLNAWWRGDPNAYGLAGNGSARCPFSNQPAGRILELKTPYLNLGNYGGTITYDYAYSAYINASAIDQLEVQYSTNWGSSFNNLATYTGAPDGGMATAPPYTYDWSPSSTQWATRTLILPAGTNMVKFKGTSGYSGYFYIDNVKFEKKLFAYGTGQDSDPYPINTAEEFNLIRNYLGSASSRTYFKLTSDIDLNPYGNSWVPIGNNSSYFFGGLDGDNHTITNLRIASYGTYHGLFGITGAGSLIKNLNLTNTCYILGDGDSGSIIGHNKGTIDNCRSAATVNIGNATIGGGICGNHNAGSIINCSFSGTVSRSGSGVTANSLGGIAGRNETGAIITNCSSSATITGSTWNGGLVGWNSGTINSSFSTGIVNCNNNSNGGLVGQNQGSINNSYSRVNVTGAHFLGGLVGYHGGGSMVNCYSTGTVSGSTRGGLIGHVGGTVTNSYWDTQTSGLVTSYGGTGKTTAEMKTQSTFTGWDFVGETANGTNDYWSIFSSLNDAYPCLGSFYADVLLPAALAYPADQATGLPISGFDLVWTPSPVGQVAYEYEIWMGQGDISHMYDHCFGTTNTHFNPVTQGGLTFHSGEQWYWIIVTYTWEGAAVLSEPGSSFTIEVLSAPTTPVIHSISRLNSSVTLNWNACDLANSYKIYASNTPEVAIIPANLIGQVAGLSYTVPANASRMFYRVIASTDSAPSTVMRRGQEAAIPEESAGAGKN